MLKLVRFASISLDSLETMELVDMREMNSDVEQAVAALAQSAKQVVAHIAVVVEG